MKKFRLFLFISIISPDSAAQAKPSYSQYVLNNYILNPGVTGIENYIDVKVSTRNQWTGINGAPVTTYLKHSWTYWEKRPAYKCNFIPGAR